MYFRKDMPPAGLVRTTFSFSAADTKALSTRVDELGRRGVSTKAVTLLRALIYMTSESDLIARCVRLTAALALSGESEPPTHDRPDIQLEKVQLEKLDGVVRQLSRANIVATRTFAVRALLAEAPVGQALGELYAAFEHQYPLRPRGLSALRLARKSRGSS